MNKKNLFLAVILSGIYSFSFSMEKGWTDFIHDTTIVAKDTVARQKHSPAKAAIRSAIIPGWGQAYNKKYWKIPIVYAALGTTTYVFFDNIRWYNRTRFAFTTRFNKDSANFNNIHPQLQRLSLESLRFNRNEFRKNVDYSALVFLLFWGVNVLDATVDGHLKDFDVSNDLSLKIKPGYSPMANTSGISLVLNFKNPKPGNNYLSK